MPWLSEPVRAWIYRVMLALLAIAVAYKIVDPNEAVVWGGFVLALIGNGLATLNTTTSNGKDPTP